MRSLAPTSKLPHSGLRLSEAQDPESLDPEAENSRSVLLNVHTNATAFLLFEPGSCRKLLRRQRLSLGLIKNQGGSCAQNGKRPQGDLPASKCSGNPDLGLRSQNPRGWSWKSAQPGDPYVRMAKVRITEPATHTTSMRPTQSLEVKTK